MEGKISVTSTKGEGSEFVFEVPVEVDNKHLLQTQFREIASKIKVVKPSSFSQVYGKPLVSLLDKLEKFAKGSATVRFVSLAEYLEEPDMACDPSSSEQECDKVVVLGAEQLLMTEANSNIYPLFSTINRGALISLLHSNFVTQSHFFEPATMSKPAPESGTKAVRILLVEDNLINAEVILAMLESENVTIKHVENGQLACDALAEKSYDLVLMDVQMPVIDGYTATAEIRKTDKKTPIIGLSANVLPEEVQMAKDKGMNDYLAKPVLRASLLEKISLWSASPQD